jgi:hypothetical protein
MKKFQTTAAAVAAVLGLGGAFAFTPHNKALPNLVQVRQNANGTFTYFNTPSAPVTGATCESVDKTSACTFSSTSTASFFNLHNTTAIPTSNGTSVNYVNTTNAFVPNH